MVDERLKILESKTGYDRICKQIASLCTTEGAREKFTEETFSENRSVIRRRLLLCDQLRQILMMESGFPGGEYFDIGSIVKKAGVEGAFLDVNELLTLRRALVAVGELVVFFAKLPAESYPDIKGISSGIDYFPAIVNHIETIADKFGNVKDNTSPELYAIRRTIRERESQVSKKMQQILSQARKSGIVDADSSVSIRDGRAVIPVSAANKRKLKGFVHDESATGKTFYIEPVEIVEINNEIKELEYDERREIVRILTVFTEQLRPDLDGISGAGDFLTEVDMIRAKARFALENGCVMPIISDDGKLILRKARHPLLAQTLGKEGKEVVPLDLTLDRQKRILIISGPNAGGKSVCLKTVGIIQWMFQCGLTVPVLENSELPVFDSIFIDIGDEQSIDNDLSTYSSHLHNMKRMLQSAGPSSLILIDEFGTGTEPVIGGAIAEAILERLEEKGCYGVITTHYSNLKYYASNAKGVVNGAMAFDVRNIMPLFRLEMGKPGSSFAVEIARKIGLPEDIIRSASDKAGSDHINIEKQLREIARDKRYWEQKRDRIRIADRKVEGLEQKYAEQLASIKQLRSDILRQAKEEAAKITAEANKRIENAIKTIRETQAEKEMTRFVRRDIEEFRESLAGDDTEKLSDGKIDREMEKILRRKQKREENKTKRGEKTVEQKHTEETQVVREGSKVRIEGQDMVGEVHQVKGKKATVAFGQILTTVPLERLTVVSNSEFKKQQRNTAVTIRVSEDLSQRKLNFRDNIDVRGMRASEALDKVEDFIDDAIMVGVRQVRILHGKGTGALKEEIRKYLRAVDLVVSAVDEHVEMGGAGITVVTLDV